jgi:hypothetical protein
MSFWPGNRIPVLVVGQGLVRVIPRVLQFPLSFFFLFLFSFLFFSAFLEVVVRLLWQLGSPRWKRPDIEDSMWNAGADDAGLTGGTVRDTTLNALKHVANGVDGTVSAHDRARTLNDCAARRGIPTGIVFAAPKNAYPCPGNRLDTR